MDSQGFITVGKKSSTTMQPQKKTPVCYWCKTPGHIKSTCDKFQAKLQREEEQKMREERVSNMTCPWCKEKGHGWNFCQKRKDSFNRKEEKQKKFDEDFPATVVVPVVTHQPVKSGWTGVVKQCRDEQIVEKIDKAEREFKKKLVEKKEKSQADYLERVRLREERKQMEDLLYVNDMEKRFGTKWFNWVNTIEKGKHDSSIAANLRYKYEEEQDKREEMERQVEKEAQERIERDKAEDEEKQRTLSRTDYNKWRLQKEEDEDEEMDSWLEQGSLAWQLSEIQYLNNAPPLYRDHYRKTCRQLNWNEKILENIELSWPTKK